MSELIVSVEEVKELIAAVKEQKIARLKLVQGDFSLCIETGSPVVGVAAAPPVLSDTVALPADEEAVFEVAETGTVVTSPIVGTFYQSPAPEKPPFVTVGSKVEKGDVIFIIESMKLMNEVISDFSGTVTKIHVENGQGVEYGQPILTIG